MVFNLTHGLTVLATKHRLRPARVLKRLCTACGLLLRARRICFSTYKLFRFALVFLSLAGMLFPVPSSSAQQSKVTEYRAKANFLAVFPNFIEWPADAFSSEQAPLLICVFGDFSFGTSLAEMTRGASIRGRQVEVRWARKEQELRACQILFVSRSENKHYAKILKAIQGASVLTVGETPDFLASGGVIDFLAGEDKLQFEVNLGAANDARLTISSNMLALARHVINRTEAAKS